MHYPITEAGVWVDCVYQQKPVIHNDYASLSHRKGMPEGHAELVRELVVPVFRGNRIKAILAVGNKPSDYRTIYNINGDFQNLLKVYGREGESCVHCGQLIVRIVQKGRSSFVCESCQK